MLQNQPWPGIALGFTLATVVISVFQVPFYSVASCLALHYRHNSIYYETPRDCYEAWVIYNFMSLCMAYIGGPGAVVVKCEGKVIQPSWVLMTCCMKPIPVDGFFLRRCKQGTLQFVIAKPILAALTLILFITGNYHVSNWAWNDGFGYIALIYNICYAVALFWLLLLYVGTDELLKPYKPMLKFACFKAVIFLTFWQSLLISFLATRMNMGYEDAEALQNWIIVAEMFFAAVGMIFAFPWSEYQIGGAAKGWSWDAFLHAVSISDVISDIMHQFNPSYGTYVLYHDGGPEKNVKKKKFLGAAKERTQEDSTFSAASSAMTQTVRKPRRHQQAAYDMEEANGDEEASQWYGGDGSKQRLIDRVTNVFGVAGDRIQETGHQIIAIIPGITEQERNQAELVDSDSDAEYDEENVRDNQVGNELLATSDDDDDDDDDNIHYLGHGGGGSGGGAGSASHAIITHKPSGVDSGALPDSTSRVEAAMAEAFGLGVSSGGGGGTGLVSDSVARVEMAFADAFGPPAVAPAAVAAAAALPAASSTPTAAVASSATPSPAASATPALLAAAAAAATPDSQAFASEAFSEVKASTGPLGATVVPLLAPPAVSRSPMKPGFITSQQQQPDSPSPLPAESNVVAAAAALQQEPSSADGLQQQAEPSEADGNPQGTAADERQAAAATDGGQAAATDEGQAAAATDEGQAAAATDEGQAAAATDEGQAAATTDEGQAAAATDKGRAAADTDEGQAAASTGDELGPDDAASSHSVSAELKESLAHDSNGEGQDGFGEGDGGGGGAQAGEQQNGGVEEGRSGWEQVLSGEEGDAGTHAGAEPEAAAAEAMHFASPEQHPAEEGDEALNTAGVGVGAVEVAEASAASGGEVTTTITIM